MVKTTELHEFPKRVTVGATQIAIQKSRFRGFQLFYRHQDAAESMCRESDSFPAFFAPLGERPLIIDAGSNIGVSVLEWKFRWPQCEVICFEPENEQSFLQSIDQLTSNHKLYRELQMGCARLAKKYDRKKLALEMFNTLKNIAKR